MRIHGDSTMVTEPAKPRYRNEDCAGFIMCANWQDGEAAFEHRKDFFDFCRVISDALNQGKFYKPVAIFKVKLKPI